MCLYCLLVLDYMPLCRSIYLRGIPLGGLPMIFYRQLARQVGMCVLFPCRTRWLFPQALCPSHSPARSSWSDPSHGSSMLTELESSSSRCRSVLRRPHPHLRLPIRSSRCLAVHADQRIAPHALILWTGPPLMVRPMSCLVGTGGHTPIGILSTCL